MGKRQALVCTHCGKEKCDGIVYKIADKHSKDWDENDYYRKWRGCKNDHRIEYKEGTPHFHWVMGHGIDDWWELEEEK